MRHERQGLERWANTDPSMHCNTIQQADDSWRNEYLALLMDHDYEGAHQIRLRNDPKYKEETEPTVTVLKSEGSKIRSCREVQIERDEAAA